MGFTKGIEVTCNLSSIDIDFSKLREKDELDELWDKVDSVHENSTVFGVDSILKAKKLAIKYGYLIEGTLVFCPGCTNFINKVREVDSSILTLNQEKKVKRTRNKKVKAIKK